MALRGGPPNQCRITGMPSLGEGPSGGARAFCLLLTGPAFRLSKVRRRNGATLSSRYRSNGSAHNFKPCPALSRASLAPTEIRNSNHTSARIE
jgi:hypothetical protein